MAFRNIMAGTAVVSSQEYTSDTPGQQVPLHLRKNENTLHMCVWSQFSAAISYDFVLLSTYILSIP